MRLSSALFCSACLPRMAATSCDDASPLRRLASGFLGGLVFRTALCHLVYAAVDLIVAEWMVTSADEAWYNPARTLLDGGVDRVGKPMRVQALVRTHHKLKHSRHVATVVLVQRQQVCALAVRATVAVEKLVDGLGGHLVW